MLIVKRRRAHERSCESTENWIAPCSIGRGRAWRVGSRQAEDRQWTSHEGRRQGEAKVVWCSPGQYESPGRQLTRASVLRITSEAHVRT
jgi:hypothetical protein